MFHVDMTDIIGMNKVVDYSFLELTSIEGLDHLTPNDREQKMVRCQ